MKRFAKLITFILACILLIGAVVAVSVSAAQDEATGLEIKGKNVDYQVMNCLLVAVGGVNEDNRGTVAMLFWNEDPGDNATAETATLIDRGAQSILNSKGERIYYFRSFGVAAQDMSSDIYYAPALLNKWGHVVTVGDVQSYSIVEYAVTRLKEQNGTAAQSRLYENLLVYAGASEAVLGDKNLSFALITAENGYVGNYDASAIGANEGEQVLLRAEAKNARGEYFLYWEKNGEKFSDCRVTSSASAVNGKTVYTAVYGDKAASAYAATLNFENYSPANVDENGMIAKQKPETASIYVNSGHIYNYDNYTYGGDNCLVSGLELTLPYTVDGVPVSKEAVEGAETVVDKNGTTYYVTGDKFTFTDDDQEYAQFYTNPKTGDVDLMITKNNIASTGITSNIWNLSSAEGGNYFEYDICFESNVQVEAQIALEICKVGTTSGRAQLANISLDIQNDGRIRFYVNGEGATKTVDGIAYTSKTQETLGYMDYTPGETLTLGVAVRYDKALPEVDFYGNGEYRFTAGITELDAEAGTAHHPFANFAAVFNYNSNDKYYLRLFRHFQLRAVSHTQTIDNATFFGAFPYTDNGNEE